MTSQSEILLVEDNAADVTLLRHCFPKTRQQYHFTIAVNGEEASDYLFRRGTFSGRVVPHVIILDLNLPRKNGKEVLSEIKAIPDLLKVPVLIITGSNNPEDRRACLELGATRFLIKPSSLEAMNALSSVLTEYLPVYA